MLMVKVAGTGDDESRVVVAVAVAVQSRTVSKRKDDSISTLLYRSRRYLVTSR